MLNNKAEKILFILFIIALTFLMLTGQVSFIVELIIFLAVATVLVFILNVAVIYASAIKVLKSPSIELFDLSKVEFIDQAFLGEITQELVTQEFDTVGDFMMHWAKGVESCARIFTDESRTTLAQLTFVWSKAGQVSVLYFSSGFEGENLLLTQNSLGEKSFKNPDWMRVFSHPNYSAKELLEKHREHLRVEETTKKIVKIPEDVSNSIIKGTRRLYEANIKFGILKEEKGAEFYSYTPYGALYVMARTMGARLKALSPFAKKEKVRIDNRFGIRMGKGSWILTIVYTIVLVAILLGAFYWYLYSKEYSQVRSPINECDTMYKNIENIFEYANYCSVDSDCKSIQLGGAYVEFGCWKYVNKSYDADVIFEQLDEYVSTCTTPINKCAQAPQAVCRENKCVEPR